MSFKYLNYLFYTGIIFLTGIIVLDILNFSFFYKKVLVNSLTPIAFSMMILGSYFWKFERWKPLKFIGYYSYNWYLWHPICVIVSMQFFENIWIAFFFYLTISFAAAILTTTFIEEPVLKYRKKVLG